MKILLAIILVTLPAVHFAQSNQLTARYDTRKKTVNLKWQNSGTIERYVLQRSDDTHSWKDIASINSRKLARGLVITYEDGSHDGNKNYYRLKKYLKSSYDYTTPVAVTTGEMTYKWIMFPVPVTYVLNLQYSGSKVIPGVISIIVQSESGKIYYRLRFASTTRHIQVPVSNLGRGTYAVRIFVPGEVVWHQRFVK